VEGVERTADEREGRFDMVATTCPHCGILAEITYFPKYHSWTEPLLSWISSSKHQWLSGQRSTILEVVDEIDRLFTVPMPQGAPEKWKMARCGGCRQPLFVILDEQESRVLRTFPPISLERPPDVPIGVADDYVEATLCLSVGAYKAAAALCRRALQAAALDKGCKRRKLSLQLDELGKRGLLNPSLLDVAHQVRYFGNYGAHPDEDGLGDISQEEAENIHELAWQVLEDLYVNPARVQAMKAALTQKKAERGPAPEAVGEEREPSVSEEG
jgi:hypothetical protein